MARYIDADALMERCFSRLRDGGVLYRISPQEIDDAPSADVVKVVRCVNCVSSRPLNRNDSWENAYTEDCIYCMYHDMGMKKDGFCSCGVAKECDDGNNEKSD